MKRVVPDRKIFSADKIKYDQKSISARLEALFLNNIDLVLTRERIVEVATDPVTGREPENWHQRLSELRTDKDYTILAQKDWRELAPGEYVMPNSDRRAIAAKRVTPAKNCWEAVIEHANRKFSGLKTDSHVDLRMVTLTL